MSEVAKPAPNPLDRIVREPEREALTGISRVTAWRLERSGRFPKRIWLTENTVGWRLSEITAWLNERTRVGAPANSVRTMAIARAAKQEQEARDPA